MEDVLITVAVFGGLFFLIKVFTDFLLKRKLIKAGHVDKAGILDETPKNKEENSYPTLKWGLITLFAGLGLLVISLIERSDSLSNYGRLVESYMSVGIELIAISLGFLFYFIIIRFSSK
ncbi:MAG: hypothetical protein JXK95_13240 [Bacteroidales bacterium]|nr:hypothetical protein [Bacteroidales bacterium]